MTKNMARVGLVLLLAIAVVAMGAYLVACGSGGTNTSDSNSTNTTTSETGTTIVEGGKSLDSYQAEIPGLQKAIAADPKDLASLQELAVAYYQLSQYENAEGIYKQILTISPSAFGYNNLGNVYRDWGKTDQAITEYRTAISIDKTLKQPYINLAGLYQRQGDLESALKVLDEAKAALNSTDQQTIDEYKASMTSTTTT